MNQPGNQEFADLMRRVRGGEEQAIADLVSRYEPEVRLVARVRLGAPLRPYVDSVDIMQSLHRSLLIGLRENRFQIDGPNQLVALAVTIVRRKVARQWRKLRRQTRLSGGPRGTDESDGPLPQLLASLATPLGNPASMVAFRDQVERFLSSLSEQERKLIELRLEGCSTVEAARQMGLDADVTRVRLSRLRKRLREQGIDLELL